MAAVDILAPDNQNIINEKMYSGERRVRERLRARHVMTAQSEPSLRDRPGLRLLPHRARVNRGSWPVPADELERARNYVAPGLRALGIAPIVIREAGDFVR
ncbi:MAG: hypothetical protein ACREMQ_14065 [Longimicrobiales bacterium]